MPLREVWKHEAHDFTRWLEENIDVLNEVTALQLSNVEREQKAGEFKVDLTAEDESGNRVIIENQLERSNHDHLGKLVTYLAAMEAKIAIWIVSDPRPEHVGAISWLNESATSLFYLLKIEAVRIEDSPAAPLLTLIVGPSEETKEIGVTKQEWADRHRLRHRFWTGLLEAAKRKTSLHANISPSKDAWILTGAGRTGLSYIYRVRRDAVQVEFYIDRGKEGKDKNTEIFNRLQDQREDIEKQFGGPLEWDPLEGRQSCVIRKILPVGGWRDEEEKWPDIYEAMIDAMVRLDRAVSPHTSKLEI